MDALVPLFVIAALAEIGDRTQLLGLLLGRRFASKGAVLAGIALATILNMAIGAAAGAAIGQVVSHRAIQLFTGLALFLAGTGGLLRVKKPDSVEGWRLGAFLSSALAFFILELGDKTQFITAAISAGSGAPVFAAIGAAAGVTLASAPAVLLADRWPMGLPIRAIRLGVGLLLMLAGLVLAIRALELA